MRVAIFSDLHAHPFKAYATILPTGMNSRLAYAVDCIKQIATFCGDPANMIEMVAFAGDLFHVRKTINVSAFNAVYEAMALFRVAGIPVVLIHGNHDQANKLGTEHSIHAFRAFCTVIDEPGWAPVEGKSGDPLAFMGIPYTENVEHLHQVVRTPNPEPLAPSMLLGHLGIQGAKVGADFVYATPYDATVEDLNVAAFDAVYLGHYHMHQRLAPNAWYVGAPLQHNWGDKGQERGFLVYDTVTKAHVRVPLKAPCFVEVRSKNAPCKGNYLRIEDAKSWSEDAREDFRASVGARSVEVVPPKEVAAKAGPRLAVSPSVGFQEALEIYVRSGVQPYDGLEADYLLQLGQEILEEAEGE